METGEKTGDRDLDVEDASSRILVRPGLRADREEKTVRIQAEATGLDSESPVEFLLVSPRSGHAYEAIAVSEALPGDVQEALEFIGMQPGLRPSVPDFRFWPKGERVVATVEWEGDPLPGGQPGTKRSERFENFIRDTRTGKAIPAAGWVFTGSPEESAGGKRVFAADAQEPGSILSIYNEPVTVLDVPRPAIKGEVYGYQLPHPDLILHEGQRIEIVLEPEYKDGRIRVRDYRLGVRSTGNASSNILGRLRFSIQDPDTKTDLDVDTKGLLAFFGRITKKGLDPFVTVAPDASLTLNEVKTLYAFLDGIQGGEGIRMDPPAAEHLFYKTFLPNETFRDPAERPSQPWELHLERRGDRVVGRLREIKTTWEDIGLNPTFETRETPAATPGALKRVLSESENDLPVLLIFAPGALTYDELLDFIRPVRETHSTVYVFLPVDRD